MSTGYHILMPTALPSRVGHYMSVTSPTCTLPVLVLPLRSRPWCVGASLSFVPATILLRTPRGTSPIASTIILRLVDRRKILDPIWLLVIGRKASHYVLEVQTCLDQALETCLISLCCFFHTRKGKHRSEERRTSFRIIACHTSFS